MKYPHWPILAALFTLITVVTFLLFELSRTNVGPEVLWPTRLDLASMLLLLYTLIVLWLYADWTHGLLRASETQLSIARTQLAAASRPCVVITLEKSPNGTRRYMATNLGAGVALNVVYVFRHYDGSDVDVHQLGAIRAGDAIPLPDRISNRLTEEADDALKRRRHVVFAEPIGATGIWIVSDNVMEKESRLSHRVIEAPERPEYRGIVHGELPSEALFNALGGDLKG